MKIKSWLSGLLAAACIFGSAVIVPPSHTASAATIGSVDMDGDSGFDSDSLADNSATQYRWLSYPGSRLSLNANQATDVKAPAGPIDSRLSLGLGGWFGTSAKNLNEIIRTEIASPGGSAASATTRSTTWYPYKIAFNASYAAPSGTSLSGYDFMKDNDSTVMRVVQVSASVANDVVLTGKITGSGGGQWIGGTDKVVLVSDSAYYYAIHFVSLSGSGLTPVELNETATISNGEWTFRKSFAGSGNLAAAIGIASASEGSATAIARAKGAFAQNVTTTLADVKGNMDDLLQRVPAPADWGISGIDAKGVTAQQHEKFYYSAWAFIVQSLVKSLPENAASYPYPQMMTGKPSLWNVGASANPGTAQWESAFGYQMLSFIDPSNAWQAYKGLISVVNASGMIGGESLPTRLAEAAWILYQNTGSTTDLADIYPNLKKFMDWAEDNPRWICCGHDIPEEKDFEFVASWLFDASFMIEIANELGYTSDATLWQSKRTAMLGSLQNWFFTDPTVIYHVNYTYPNQAPIYAVGNDMFKLSALSIDGLTATQLAALKSNYMSIHRPDDDLNNFPYHKYPDASLIVYGLLNHGGHVQARELAESSLRDAIRAKELGEATVPTGSGIAISSVVPSLFTAIQGVEFTWLLNGARLDSGELTAFSFDTSSLTVPNSPDALPTLEDFKDISDWSNPYNSSFSALGGAGLFRFIDKAGGSYGFAQKSFSYNIDENPKLTIKVDQVYGSAQWALKVSDGGGDITLQSDTAQTGELTYDLKAATGWSGVKSYTLKLYLINGDIKVSGIAALQYTVEDFDDVSDWSRTWQAGIASSSGVATLTSSGAYGSAKKAVSYSVDEYPKLKLKVPSVGSGSQWALKVNDGSGDIVLQADTSLAGELVYDLKAATGWSETKSFDLVLYVIGGAGKSVQLDYINLPDKQVEDFSTVSDWNQLSGATISTSAGIATVTAGSGGSGYAGRTLAYDTGRYDQLKVKVTEVGAGAQWSLVVNDGSGDVTLQAATSLTGTFTYSLASLAGWHDQHTFTAKLVVQGGSGKYIKADELAIAD